MQNTNSPHIDEVFMQRCLELALNGMGQVAPNPMVGAVVVHEGVIIGEGYHRKFGSAHAEVNAIHAVKNQQLLPFSTLYVNLEPCAHSGKTPPCTDLILQKKIPRVIIGTSDPNSLVAGKGIQKLKENGVTVITGILEDDCFKVNKRFFTFHTKKRPYVILKWARTRDGFIDLARDPGTPVGINWITSDYAKTLVHKWRSEEQGILVGTETVLLDDPKLTLREWSGEHPIRIVLDRNLRIPRSASIWDGTTRTLIYNTVKSEVHGNTELIKPGNGMQTLQPVLEDLYHRGISSIIVEGGKKVLEHFLINKLWDEARVFEGNKNFKRGIRSPKILGDKIMELKYFKDTISFYRPKVKQ